MKILSNIKIYSENQWQELTINNKGIVLTDTTNSLKIVLLEDMNQYLSIQPKDENTLYYIKTRD